MAERCRTAIVAVVLVCRAPRLPLQFRYFFHLGMPAAVYRRTCHGKTVSVDDESHRYLSQSLIFLPGKTLRVEWFSEGRHLWPIPRGPFFDYCMNTWLSPRSAQFAGFNATGKFMHRTKRVL